MDMVISTKQVKTEYGLEEELEELDLKYCLPQWFYLDHEWRRYQTSRRKLLHEIKVNLSESQVELQKS